VEDVEREIDTILINLGPPKIISLETKENIPTSRSRGTFSRRDKIRSQATPKQLIAISSTI